MKRCDTRIENGTLYVETHDGWLKVGELADVYDLVGGKTYTIEYGEKQRAFAEWVNTDEDGRMEFNVRDTLAEMTYLTEFVQDLRARDLDPVGEEDYPPRTVYFANYMTKIWDTKGNLQD